MDFELQVKMFTDQLVDLLEQAKQEAANEFISEKSNWGQRAREYEAEIAAVHTASVKNLDRAEKAEMAYEALRAKLSDLV